MSLFHALLLLFICVPLAEIYVLLHVGASVGVPLTVALVVLTAVLGAALMRAQGFATLKRIQASLERSEVPAFALAEGAIILLSGALLLTPGFLTDFVGFACLVPGLRRACIIRVLEGRAASSAGAKPSTGTTRGVIIDGDFRREED